MKLFLISQTENDGYSEDDDNRDFFDSAVVCAPDEDTARATHPGGLTCELQWDISQSAWCSSPDMVEVQMIGDASPGLPVGVVCASFTKGY